MKLVKLLFKNINNNKKKCPVCSWLHLSFVWFFLFWDVLAAIGYINKKNRSKSYCHKEFFSKNKIWISKEWVMMKLRVVICQQVEILANIILIILSLKIILKFLINSV